jgi:hypothetical protein
MSFLWRRQSTTPGSTSASDNKGDTPATIAQEAKQGAVDIGNDGVVPDDETREVVKLSDEELLGRLDAGFYGADFDAVGALFQSLPEDVDEHWLEREIDQKERTQQLIESALSDRVMKNYSAFVQGMTQIQQIGSDLHLTAFLCKASRQRLAKAKEELTHSSLVVLANYRKTQVIQVRGLVINYVLVNKLKIEKFI